MAKGELKIVDFEKQFKKFSERFSQETDRACAVLGAAFLDAILEGLFRSRLRGKTDALLSVNGPLGSFSSRTDLTYALAWIDEDTYADLKLIGRIRNKFAHVFDSDLDFETEEIVNRCNELRSAKAFLAGFADFDKNNPNLSSHAVQGMKDAVAAPRLRFQLAVEMVAQMLRDVETRSDGKYTGPDLSEEARAMIANLKFNARAKGLSSG